MTNLLTGHEDYITSHTRKEIIYVLSWSKRENESHIEKYHSFFQMAKKNNSVVIQRKYICVDL